MTEPFQINFPNGNTALTIRVKTEAQIHDAIKELGLRFGKPTIVLIGGAGGLTEEDSKKLQPLFLDVLAPLAETIQANVIDGGTDAGIMRLMGQSRSAIKATFPLIGIAAGGTVILPATKSSNPEAALLDSQHSHFILVPGNDWGDESPWLANIATELASDSPSVTILINGGEIARKDVNNSLSVDRSVIVIAGTGRLADELAKNENRPPQIKVANIKEGFKKVKILINTLLKEKQHG